MRAKRKELLLEDLIDLVDLLDTLQDLRHGHECKGLTQMLLHKPQSHWASCCGPGLTASKTQVIALQSQILFVRSPLFIPSTSNSSLVYIDFNLFDVHHRAPVFDLHHRCFCILHLGLSEARLLEASSQTCAFCTQKPLESKRLS